MTPDDDAARRRLRAAQAAAYGPHPDPAGADRLRALQAELDRAAVAPAAEPPASAAPPDEPRDSMPPRRAPAAPVRLLAVAGVVALAAVGFALGRTTQPAAPLPTTPPSLQEQVQQRVLASRGAFSAQDYYRLYPDDLPIDWGGASTGTSHRHLVGSTVVRLTPSAASSRLLVVPTCASADRRVDWRLLAADGRTLAAGRQGCGGFGSGLVQFSAADRAAGLRLALAAGGTTPYAVTVFEQ